MDPKFDPWERKPAPFRSSVPLVAKFLSEMEPLLAHPKPNSAPKHSEPSESRPIPRWAAPVLTRLIESAPAVVTEGSIQSLAPVEARRTIQALVRLGWLRSVGVHGAWAFLPPGVVELGDPYLSLRAWSAIDPDATFALAGATAAWHLGYLRRRPTTVSIWVKEKAALPHGLRSKFHIVTTEFPEATSTTELSPTPMLLRKRKLDLTAWSSRLPAFGPEALLVQLSQRPASIDWTELATELASVTKDADVERTKRLLGSSSNSARQRAAYFFVHSEQVADAMELLPDARYPVKLGNDGPGHWDKTTQVMDYLLTSRTSAQDKA